MPNALGEVLAQHREGGLGSLLVYLMVDARRQSAVLPLVQACRDAGAAGVELGFPFSDPIADGPVLQAAASRALQNGTGWRHLLAALEMASPVLPVAVMTYANPVFHRGLEKACREISAAGGSGLIVPDLALEESAPWRRTAHHVGLDLIQMGSPATPVSRIRSLAEASSAFLYLVSRYGTTGLGPQVMGADLRRLVAAAHSASPRLPVLVGFGVRATSDLGPIRSAGADGAIVGTAVEQLLSRSSKPEALERFLRPLVRALAATSPGA